jgi:hypothetical protein
MPVKMAMGLSILQLLFAIILPPGTDNYNLQSLTERSASQSVVTHHREFFAAYPPCRWRSSAFSHQGYSCRLFCLQHHMIMCNVHQPT